MRMLQLGTCIFCAACVLGASVGQASPLLVGSPLYPAPGEPDPVVGAPLASISMPFSAAPLYTGTLISEVYNNDTSNPYGGLTFVYQLSNDFVSLDAIHRLTINNFSGFLIDASYQIPTAALVPSLIDRSLAGTVGFHFIPNPPGVGELSPGLATPLLVLQTDASTYVSTFASVIDGTVTTVPSFSPAPIVPEPASILLMAIGAGGLLLAACRRGSRRARRLSHSLPTA